jgi:hypothetical protein
VAAGLILKERITLTVLRNAAIALAATALMATPALAQQGNWNGTQGYQGSSSQQGYNQGTSQGWQGTNQGLQGTSQSWRQNSAAAGTNGELSQRTVERIQERLQQMGFYHGNVDGNWGPETQSALRDYQQQRGMSPDGQLDFQTFADLGLMGQQNQQFGNSQYGTQNTNGTQFGNTAGQGWNRSGMNTNASANPNYQGQNSYNSGATWTGNNNGTSGTNSYNGNGTSYNSGTNNSTGATGTNGSYNTGSNTGYNPSTGSYSGYNNNHNNMNSTGTYSTGMNGDNSNANTRFGNGNPSGTTGQ